MKLYLMGSLGNPRIPELGNMLRKECGFEVFDDWFTPGPEADKHWREYEQGRGHDLVDALEGYAAYNIFDFDRLHLNETEIALLVLPAGRSAHTEFGYVTGQDKSTFILMDGEPDRYDVMYRFARQVFRNVGEMKAYFRLHYNQEQK